MTTGNSAALFFTMLFLAFVPGPTEVAVVARSLASGRAHGFVMVSGIVAADFLFIFTAVAGMSAIATGFGPLFPFVELGAGLLLVALGLIQLRARPQLAERTVRPAGAWAASFSGGLLLTLGDPKAIVGYMSLLPAFVDLTAVSAADVLIIMVLATAAVFLAKSTYIILGQRAVALVRSQRARRLLPGVAGAALVGIGTVITVRTLFALS